jgi:hypothetical protein
VSDGALERALTGDLTGWAGLPDGTGPQELAALSDGESAPGQGRIAGQPAVFRDYTGHPGPLRVFFDDAGEAFLVWADWPPGDGALAPLGPPEAVLDDDPSRFPGTVQHVWGQRGVTAYVADDGAVRALALFAPASTRYYRSSLGGTEGSPYRPRRTPG